jgi:hypothetical protein
MISTVILSFQRKGGGGGGICSQCLHFWSHRTAFLAFSKANSQTNNISTNNKQNKFPLDYFHLQDPSTVRKQTELPLHCVRNCSGSQPWIMDLNHSTHICSQSDVSDYNSNIK